ncbi:4259_t:CDS:2 [Racocetra fulgida]|uniref:4259_t:CDS:1 n=1 Tax=Racocetra fulgida TaxID=60492 RepID=A0A9N9GVU3_9GLOM|nr:4259_t:CDS:2 [Racocetra fulgida]
MADSNYIFEPKKQNVKANIQKTVHQIPGFSIEYVKSLFPLFSWIGRYNTTWLTGDLIAGITVGLVVIPQSMAYAKVAALPVEYGLYSSFVGVTIYCLFATSKDMTIGPTAVMSLLIGQALTAIASNKDNAGYQNTTIAAAFSLLAGLIVLLFGLLRLGYIVRFVSNPVIAGFTTGSAVNITISQTLGRIAIASFNGKSSNKYAYVPLTPTFEGAQSPPKGILIFRFDQKLTFPNADYIEDQVISYVKANTRRMAEMPTKANDLPWNEAKETYESNVQSNSQLPPLKAIVFDFSAVCIVDSTAVQILVNIKRTVNKYADCEVEYHFANILNESIQRALIIAGFGSVDQKASLVDIGTNTAKIDDLESKHSVEIKLSMETKKSAEISEVVIEGSEDTIITSQGKKFFHLSVEEAVIAATNGAWE